MAARSHGRGRNTGTGRVLEDMALPALERNGYEYQTQVNISQRLGCGRHIVDIVARDPESGRTILVSMKWQQTSGTAEQKIPFEAMCMDEAIL